MYVVVIHSKTPSPGLLNSKTPSPGPSTTLINPYSARHTCSPVHKIRVNETMVTGAIKEPRLTDCYPEILSIAVKPQNVNDVKVILTSSRYVIQNVSFIP